MELNLTPELEAKLTHSAAQQGRNPGELVQDVLTRYFGEEVASRGETLSPRAEAMRRLATFGQRHGLSLGGMTVKQLLQESRP
jgi:hypothetical protein